MDTISRSRSHFSGTSNTTQNKDSHMNVNLAVIKSGGKKENLVEKFLGNDNKNLNEKLNIIDSKYILFINETTQFNSLFSEIYGEMYYNFVIVQKYIFLNKEFLQRKLSLLAKIVHPSIQLFYGLLFSQVEQTTYLNFVYQYVNGLSFTELPSLSSHISAEEDVLLKLKMALKIAQIMAFLYKSNCPYLELNGRSIRLNHSLIISKTFNISNNYGSSYLEDNIITLMNIGSYLKYLKKYKIFNLENEDLYEISFHSPELIKYFNDTSLENLEEVASPTDFEKMDSWSFGCLIQELFTGKRPFNDIDSDKKQLIETLITISKGENSYKKLNEKYLKQMSMQKDLAKIKDDIVKVILGCTCGELDDRFNFDDLIIILSETLKKYVDTNKGLKVTNEEAKISESFDLKRYQEIKYLHSFITQSKETTGELRSIEKIYSEKVKLYEKYNVNKENVELTHFFEQKSRGNYIQNIIFIKNDSFSDFYIYDIFQGDLLSLNLDSYKYSQEIQEKKDEDEKEEMTKNTDLILPNEENKLNLYQGSCIYYSTNKKGLIISGGSENVIVERNQRTFSRLHRKSTFTHFFLDEDDFKSGIAHFPIVRYDDSRRGTKVFTEVGNSLITRSNHSIIEVESYIFLIGGEQDTKCEFLDLRSNVFYFIEELNTIHVRPILYFNNECLFSLNFENIKKNYTSKKTYNLSDIKHLSYMKGYIFCERINVKDLLSKSKWEIIEIGFNLPDDFCFEDFTYYKHLEIKDEVIYIVGVRELSDTKLNGVSFNIKNREFNLLEGKLLKKLEVLRSSLGLVSNIVEYSNRFYFFNCILNVVESISFEYLFS